MKQPIVDLTYIKSIAGDDEGFIKEMLQMFLASTPAEIDNIEKYFKENDYRMMAASAHKIKAPVQMMGDKDITDLLLSIEMAAKNNAPAADVEVIIEKVKTKMNVLIEAVKELI
jgi:HPt (histidine-containing phosphotransfer) domain-containing protein